MRDIGAAVRLQPYYVRGFFSPFFPLLPKQMTTEMRRAEDGGEHINRNLYEVLAFFSILWSMDFVVDQKTEKIIVLYL